MNNEKVPEHAARIETPEEIGSRVGEVETAYGMASRAVTIDRDQIRRALGFALIGEAEMPRECLARVREVLMAIGGPL